MWNKCSVVLIVLNSLLIAQTADAPTSPQTPSPKIWATDDVNNLPEFRKITSPIYRYVRPQEGSQQTTLTPIPLPGEGSGFVRPRQMIERHKVSGVQTFRRPKENAYVKGELVIQFNEQGRPKLKVDCSTEGIVTTGISRVDALNTKYNARDMTRVIKDEDLPPKAIEYRLDLIYVLKVDETLDLEKASKEYQSIAEVKGCSPNRIGYTCNVAKTYPNDPQFDWAPNITQGPEAWTLTRGSSSDTIAILDIEQFNNGHPDLNNNYVGFAGGTSPLGTGSWHGTGCAGHACAELNNSIGPSDSSISGSAGGWGATKGILWMPYRFTSLADNIAAVSWAVTNRACVISQSIAFSGATAGLEDAFTTALASNVLAFAAAGNENNSSLTYPSPAMYSCVVAVGGIDWLDRHWAWSASSGSDYGSHIDVVSPGDAHWSCNATGYIDTYGGTSWATPRAAGIAAMVVNYRNIRGAALKELMERTADETEYLSVGKYAWFPPYTGLMGSGRVNAYEALMAYDKNISTNWIAASSNNVPYINCKDMYLDFDANDVLHGRHSHSLAPQVPTRVRAMVQNRGKQTESFYVTCTVDSAGTRVFTNRQLVTGLASSKARVVTFDPFKVGADGFDYRVNVISDLAGDLNRRNDTFGITARSTRNDTVQYDVGDWDIAYTDSFAAWAVRFMPERACTLKAVQFMLYAGGTACTLLVWDESQGKPGSRIGTVQAYTPGGGPSWNTVALASPVFVNKPVWIGFKTPGGASEVAPCLDRRSDAGKSYYAASGGGSGASDWGSLGEDLLLRPIVAYQGVNTNDAAIRTINAPPGVVVTNTAQLPQVTVGNVGTGTSSFDVVCRIDSAGTNLYSVTRSVSFLAFSDTARVAFDPWTPVWEDGTYNMTVYTNLGGDQNRRNDTLRLNVTPNSTVELTAGEGSAAYYFGSPAYFAVKFTPDGPCSVMSGVITIYRYNGNQSCSLFVWSDNNGVPGGIMRGPIAFSGSPYNPSWATTNLTPSPYYTTGPFWLGTFSPDGSPNGKSVLGDDASPPNNGRSYVSTTRTGPWNLGSHNWLIHANIKYLSTYSHDVGVQSLDAPPAIIKQRTPLTPSATIRNYGNSTETFNVRCTFDTSGIAVYGSTKPVTNLMPTQTITVDFDPFSVESLYKYYHQRVTTLLVGDQNTANDSLIDSTYCSDLDIISYSTNTYYYWDDDTTCAAVRFTPEKPCSLVGTWIALQDTLNQWVNNCSTFVWDARADGKTRPGTRYWAEQYVPPAPGSEAAWFRRSIPSRFYDRNTDFWVGAWTTNTGTHMPDLLLDNYLHHERSYVGQRSNATWWYPILGDWNIEAIVKYRRMDSPMAPYVLGNKTGLGNTHVYLRWQKILQDTLGNPTDVDHYIVYRDTTPRYVPGVGSFLNGIPDTTYTDMFVVDLPSDYFYLVKARDVYDQYSKPSNMAYKFRQFLNENPATTDKNWISVPYNSPYDSANHLYSDIGIGVCQFVTRRDPVTQLFRSCYWTGSGWAGDFPIVKGQMYEVVMAVDSAVRIVGSHDPNLIVSLNENPATTDKNWISIPYNAIYDSANHVYSDIGIGVCQFVTRRDPVTQLFRSCYWTGSGWAGDFPIVRGAGYEIVVATDASWKPKVYDNTTGGSFSVGGQLARDIKRGPIIKTPVWSDAQSVSDNSDVSNPNDDAVNQAARGPKQFVGGEPHLVRGCVDKTDDINLTMMAYMLDRPDEVLTDEVEGCGIKSDGRKAFWWCEPGNLFTSWRRDEEIVVVLDKEVNVGRRDHRAYFGATRASLDASENHETLPPATLMMIPVVHVTRTDSGNDLSWTELRNVAVVGYSLCRGEDGVRYPIRVNSGVLTGSRYFDRDGTSDSQYALRVVYAGGHESRSFSANSVGAVFKTEELSSMLPSTFDFCEASSNPFTRNVRFRYQVPTTAVVSIEVFDLAGKNIATLTHGVRAPGIYATDWNACDFRGEAVSSGIYFVKMKTKDFSRTVKVSFVKEK